MDTISEAILCQEQKYNEEYHQDITNIHFKRIYEDSSYSPPAIFFLEFFFLSTLAFHHSMVYTSDVYEVS